MITRTSNGVYMHVIANANTHTHENAFVCVFANKLNPASDLRSLERRR